MMTDKRGWGTSKGEWHCIGRRRVGRRANRQVFKTLWQYEFLLQILHGKQRTETEWWMATLVPGGTWKGHGEEIQRTGQEEVWRQLLFSWQQIWLSHEQHQGCEGWGDANILGVCEIHHQWTNVKIAIWMVPHIQPLWPMRDEVWNHRQVEILGPVQLINVYLKW